MHKWQRGFLLCEACGLLMSCLLPTHVRTLCLLAAGTCWSMESEQSRAEGGQELTIHAAADLWSISFYWAALASLRAIWNLVFILFWQRQQHLELFEYPFLPTAFECFPDSWKTWSMSALTAAPVLCLSSLSAAPCAWGSNSDPAQLCNLAQSAGKKAVRKSGEVRKVTL